MRFPGASWARAFLVGVVGVLAGCAPQAPPGRVLVVGIDGADPGLVERWTEAGELPNLAALAQTGGRGLLQSHHPLLSPRVWTSMATGKIPLRHGIHRWVRVGRDHAFHLYRSVDRRGHALWNIASEAGLSVAVVNWLITHPPEKLRGVMISDFAIPGERQARQALGRSMVGGHGPVRPPAGTAVTVYPAEWAVRFKRLAAQALVPEGVTDTSSFFGPGLVKDEVEKSFRADVLAARAAFEIERELRPDLMMVYWHGVDRISHFLWSAMEPPEAYPEALQLTPDQRERHAAALLSHYRAVDLLLGRLLEGYGPRDLVLVVSDHGFEALTQSRFGITGGHETALAENGIVYARGPGIAPGSLIEDMSVNDVTPTVLAWLGLPLGADMDGRPAGFVDLEAIETIATYDTTEIEHVGEGGDTVEAQILDQLRTLGYVD